MFKERVFKESALTWAQHLFSYDPCEEPRNSTNVCPVADAFHEEDRLGDERIALTTMSGDCWDFSGLAGHLQHTRMLTCHWACATWRV